MSLPGEPAKTGCIRLGLSKNDKLKYKSQFDRVRKEGRKLVGAGFLVVAAPADRLMCGVICSKKYSLLSVERNRARRLLWESFRLLKPRISPAHLVLIPRHRMMSYSRVQATAELETLLERLSLLAPQSAASPPQC